MDDDTYAAICEQSLRRVAAGNPDSRAPLIDIAKWAKSEIASLRERLAEAENSKGFEDAMRHTAKILPNAGIAAIIEEWDSNAPDAALEESRDD